MADTKGSVTADVAASIALPDYAPVPRSAIGPALNDQGYYVGKVERNLYWVTDGTYQAAFLTTPAGVVLFDAPPTIGHNLQRAIDEIAKANGVSNKGDLSHLLTPPRRPRRRVLALREGCRSRRARGDAAAPAARQRPGQARAGRDVFGPSHPTHRGRTHRAGLARL